jgi:hypothetical protein
VCADWVQRLGRDPDASFEAQPESRSVRIAGVLAPASPRRRAFIPVPTPRRRRPTIPPNCAKSTRKQTREGEKAPRKKPKNRARTNPYIRWSELLRRSYGIDIFTCPHCNGRRRILAFLEDPVVVHKILDHLGLPKEPRAPQAAARRALLSRKQGPPNATVAAVHESRRATATPRPREGAVSRTGTGLDPPQVPRRMPSRLRSPQAQGRQVAASTRLDLPSLTAPSVIGPCQETGRGACASGRGRANVQGARVIRRESRELLGALRRRSIYARSAFPRDPNT